MKKQSCEREKGRPKHEGLNIVAEKGQACEARW